MPFIAGHSHSSVLSFPASMGPWVPVTLSALGLEGMSGGEPAHRTSSARVSPAGGGGVRQEKAVGMRARGREPPRSAEDFPAAGVHGALEMMHPGIIEVMEASGLLLITAFPSLLKLVC